ncbi:MAG: hypothetical protein K8R89_04460 [Anaerolineae bacterium]|nr:hypothetical protein [Anaerolineae bacterium]
MKRFTAITLFLLIALTLLPAGYVSAQEPIPPAPPLTPTLTMTPTLISSPFGEETDVEVDITNLESLIACPPSLTNVTPVCGVAGRCVDSVFIGSCTNAHHLGHSGEVVRVEG